MLFSVFLSLTVNCSIKILAVLGLFVWYGPNFSVERLALPYNHQLLLLLLFLLTCIVYGSKMMFSHTWPALNQSRFGIHASSPWRASVLDSFSMVDNLLFKITQMIKTILFHFTPTRAKSRVKHLVWTHSFLVNYTC